MGKRTRQVTGKTHAKRPRDLWPTIDRRAIAPLMQHLQPGVRYAEPMAGGGHLIILLNETSAQCVYAADLKPEAHGVVQADAMTAPIPPEAEVVITNPPWTRDLLHSLIVPLSDQRPTWLLFDADWQNTGQAARFAPRLRKIVHVGRLIWVHGTSNAGFTACCWYLFDKPKAGNVPQAFLHGVAPPDAGGRALRVCPDCDALIDRFARWQLQSRNGVPTPVHRDCRCPSGSREPAPTPLFDCLGGQ